MLLMLELLLLLRLLLLLLLRLLLLGLLRLLLLRTPRTLLRCLTGTKTSTSRWSLGNRNRLGQTLLN